MIQRFEFTYDLSHKMLKRYLAQSLGTPETVAQMSFPTLIRTASEQGLLLGEWTDWKHFRDKHNITSYTYDENMALDVVAAIPAFIAEAAVVRDQLVRRSPTL